MTGRSWRAVAGPRAAAVLVALAVALAVALVGCSATGAGDGTAADRPAVPAAGDGSARALLDVVAVRGRGPRSDYDRDRFGEAWLDVDRNGCDTRNDVLRRDLRELVVADGTGGCLALSGLLDDPYTGATIDFRRGDGQVEIDHVVSLSDAWQKGAAQWPEARLVAFANDPRNLLAVAAQANSDKSNSDAATWLPPDRSAWCPMVARQVAVKAAYGLTVTPAERDAAARVLDTCPDEPPPA